MALSRRKQGLRALMAFRVLRAFSASHSADTSAGPGKVGIAVFRFFTELSSPYVEIYHT